MFVWSNLVFFWGQFSCLFCKVRRQSQHSAYVALKVAAATEAADSVVRGLQATLQVLRLPDDQFNSRNDSDVNLKRKREDQLQSLQATPTTLLERILLLRGEGGSEKQKRQDGFLGWICEDLKDVEKVSDPTHIRVWISRL